MAVVAVAVMLAGIAWSTEGALLFTKTPSSVLYSLKGSDVSFEWNYRVDDRTTEFKFLIWKVLNKTERSYRFLLTVDVNGTVHRGFDFPPSYDGRVEKKEQATFVVKNVQFEDSTKFMCFLDGKGATPDDTSIVDLVVTGPCSGDREIYVAGIGDTATITCNATNVPGQNFTWMKQGQREKISNDEKYSVFSTTGSSQLTIKNISVADGWYYVCDGTTNANQPCLASIYLEVNYPPKKDKEKCPATIFTSAVGDNQTVCCPVSGFPPPFFTWKKNGIQLSEENSVLTIYNLEERDFGNYTCTATGLRTSLPPIDIIIKKKASLFVNVIPGTDETPAKLEIQRLPEANVYVVKVSGKDIKDDYLIGTKTSVELHYHTLVMKTGSRKPAEVKMQVEVSAFDDGGFKLRETSIRELIIKRPSDTEY